MIHHCANTITAAGVGNGSTLVICMGIITGEADLHVLQAQAWTMPLSLFIVSRQYLVLVLELHSFWTYSDGTGAIKHQLL